MGLNVIGVTPSGIGTVSYISFEFNESSSSSMADLHNPASDQKKASFSV